MARPLPPPPKRNHVGTVSLAVSAVGFCVYELAQATLGLNHPGWTLVRGGLEASLIGGVADWFAVRALFYPIPQRPPFSLPSLPHTDLVVQNRDKLTAGLVDLVENQLLSPASVAAQLKRFSASQLVIAHLESPEARTLTREALQSLAGRFAGELEDAELRSFLARLLRDQVRSAQIAPVLGRWLRDRVEDGGSRLLWTAVANFLAEQADAGSFDAYLEEALTATVRAVRDESWLKGLTARLLVNPKNDTLHIRNALAAVLKAQAENADHPLHQRLDDIVSALAQQLIDGDPRATAHVERFQATLAAEGDFDKIVRHLMEELRTTLQRQLAQPSEDLTRVLDGLLSRTVDQLRTDAAAQARLDEWVRGVLQDLAVRHHSVIGSTVRDSMNSFPDQELVRQLETKVGGDLQFIRLNGAIIGGLVGVLIAALKLVFH